MQPTRKAARLMPSVRLAEGHILMLFRKQKLLAAIKEADSKTLTILLRRHPRLANSVLKLSGVRQRPLHVAAAGGSWDVNSVLASMPGGFQFLATRQDEDLAMCQALIRSGAITYCLDDNGNTPLHYACARGHRVMAEFLLNSGAPINASNPFGAPPLEFALYYGHDEVAAMVVERGAHLNYYEPQSPLLSACQHGCPRALRAMVASEPDTAIDQMGQGDSSGDLPLHWAARTGCREIVEALVGLGADVNAVSGSGDTPSQYAHDAAFPEVVALLQSHGGRLRVNS